MKKSNIGVFVATLLILLGYSNYGLGNDMQLSDDQIIARVDREFKQFDAEYADITSYFEKVSGVYAFPVDFQKVFKSSSEAVLLEIATRIHSAEQLYCPYRFKIWGTIDQIHTSMRELYKHVQVLEKKTCNTDEQKKLDTMLALLSQGDDLRSHINFFAEYLRYHDAYFYAHDFIEALRSKYASYFVSGGVHANMLSYEIDFVEDIESDVAKLKEHRDRLADKYESAKLYANAKLDQLSFMKNIITRDQRYQEKLHKDEKDQLHHEALAAQKGVDFDRMNEIIEQNKKIMAI
jgi:hypothetical protein